MQENQQIDKGRSVQENQQIDKGRGLIFSIYLVAVFLNAFVDLGHKIVIQNTIWLFAHLRG